MATPGWVGFWVMGTVETDTEAGSRTGSWLTPGEQDAWRAYLATSKLLFNDDSSDSSGMLKVLPYISSGGSVTPM